MGAGDGLDWRGRDGITVIWKARLSSRGQVVSSQALGQPPGGVEQTGAVAPSSPWASRDTWKRTEGSASLRKQGLEEARMMWGPQVGCRAVACGRWMHDGRGCKGPFAFTRCQESCPAAEPTVGRASQGQDCEAPRVI